MGRPNFETLRIYQLAETLADQVWAVVRQWEPLAKDTVGKQLVRAADSVGANIAEGNGRGTYRDNRQFIRNARGSLYETKHWLRRAFRRQLFAEGATDMLSPILAELTPKLNSYHRYLSQKVREMPKRTTN